MNHRSDRFGCGGGTSIHVTVRVQGRLFRATAGSRGPRLDTALARAATVPRAIVCGPCLSSAQTASTSLSFSTMPARARRYSKFLPPSLSMCELVCQKLDNDATDLLIDKWLERPHGPDAYYDWFQRVRERRHAANANMCKEQILLWNKGVFVPENIFTRTVDTGRLIPLDRTWVTHVYHHQSMSRLNMMPVIFSMVSRYSPFAYPAANGSF